MECRPAGGNESQIALLERSMVADGPQPGAEPTAVPGLWGMASEKALLHASVLRYLRYGPLPAPGFRRSTAGAPLSVEDALDDPSGVESTAASTELLSAAGEDIDKVSAAGIQVGHDAMADDGRGGQLIDGGVGTAPRQQAAAMLGRQPNSIRCVSHRQIFMTFGLWYGSEPVRIITMSSAYILFSAFARRPLYCALQPLGGHNHSGISIPLRNLRTTA